jgi:hypothetical protein
MRAPISWKIRNTFRKDYLTGLVSKRFAEWMNKASGGAVMGAVGQVEVVKHTPFGPINYGAVGYRKVTSDFVNLLVLHLSGSQSTDLDASFKFHGAGTDNTAESAGDTELIAEFAGVRATGTAATDAAGENIYKSVGTVAFTSTAGIVEHGLYNSSAGGYVMDRTVFAEIAVSSDDSIEFTYKLTVYASG